MTAFIDLLVFIFALTLLIGIHEYGHYWVARRAGIKVLTFSIGFGKTIWQRKMKSGADFVIGILPIGGYVRMLDEREAPVPDAEKHMAFNRQSIAKRLAVVIAGPLVNFVFAIFAYWLIFVVGIQVVKPVIGEVLPTSIAARAQLKPGQLITHVDKQSIQSWQDFLLALFTHAGDNDTLTLTTQPLNANASSASAHNLSLQQWETDPLRPQPLKSLGIRPQAPHIPALVDTVIKGSPAFKAGIKKGDRILRVDQQPIKNWQDFVTYVAARPRQTMALTFLQNGQRKTASLTSSWRLGSGLKIRGFIGVSPAPVAWPPQQLQKIQYSLLGAWRPAWDHTWRFTQFNFILFKKLATGKLSMQMLGGPITIFKTATQAFKVGLTAFVAFLALVSVMLATINILPIPGLDGGHALFLIIEAIRRRPLSAYIEGMATRVGILMLLCVMAFATFNDFLRL